LKYNFDEIISRHGTDAMSIDGFGPYLFDNEPNLNLKHTSEELIRMWVADMEFAVPPEIIDGIKERLKHPIFGYTGMFEARYFDAFQSWAKNRYNWEFDKEHLVTSMGIIPALYAMVEYICKPGDKVLFMTPSYSFFKHASDRYDIEYVVSELKVTDGRYEMDYEDIAQKVSQPEVNLCIFCSPHNPTGRNWSEEELKRFGDLCLSNGVKIVSDEIHCDLLRASEHFTPLAKLFPDSDQIITCMSPSKTFNLAGFMFANIIIPNDELREIWKQKNIPIVNPLSVAAAQAAYEHGHEWLEELTRYLDKNFNFLEDYLNQYLPKAKFTISDATYLAWVDLGAYFEKGKNLTLFFANQAGVILEGGNMFVDHADGYVRLNLACPQSILKEGLDRMVQAIEDHTAT